MFDSAFQNLAGPAINAGGGGLAAGSLPAVVMPNVAAAVPAAPVSSVAKPRSMLKMGILILATLGVLAALFLMVKKRKKVTTTTTKHAKKGRHNKRKSTDSDDEDSDNDSDAEDMNKQAAAAASMTTFAPLDLPPVSFPPTHRVPLPAQQPQQQMLPPVASNIRNSKGNRPSEQLMDFPPPNIDVGLGSGTPPQMRPMPPTSATLPPPQQQQQPVPNFSPL